MCKFLSNSVHFLDNHSRYAQNDSFTLGLTSFLKNSRIFRSLGSSCEKWQLISRRKGGFQPPLHLLGLGGNLVYFIQIFGSCMLLLSCTTNAPLYFVLNFNSRHFLGQSQQRQHREGREYLTYLMTRVGLIQQKLRS